MIRTFLLTVAGTALTASTGALAGKPGGEQIVHNGFQISRLSAEEQEVWRVIEAWNETFAANDTEQYFQFIDDDITVMTPSNPYRVEGLSDDRVEFEFGLRLGYSRVGLFQEIAPVVRVYGDTAFATYFKRGYYGSEEEGQMIYLKETDILRRKGERWKIVHIHVSK